MDNLKRLDLNLLLTLDVLLAEHNVTRAAERLHLSQPTVSIHLAKLRHLLHDRLLLPGPRGMRPTARAEQLRDPLRQALQALEQAIAPAAAFDPSTAEGTWKVAAFDYAESTIVLPLVDVLRTQAPGTRLAVLQTPPSRIVRELERGEIDLAFHTRDPRLGSLRHRILFAERYVLAGRIGHPRLKRRPTLDQFCKLEHVVVSPDGGGFFGATDQVLSDAGLSRRVVLSVPHFLFLKPVLATTDLVAMLPARLLRNSPELRTFEAPVDVPGYEMSMYWHERSHRDLAHQWLRECIATLI